jgi:hypothetical protein
MSIHAIAVVLLIKGIILPCHVDLLCTAISQLRLISYHIVIVRTVKDWDKIMDIIIMCSYQGECAHPTSTTRKGLISVG